MENRYQSFDFFGKPVIEYLLFNPPFSKIRMMQEEACFIYQVKANNVLYASSRRIPLGSQEAVVMKCGNYISKYFPMDIPGPSEVVVIHFYPEMLRKIYKNDLPDFLHQGVISSGDPVSQVHVDELIQGYIQNVLFYFQRTDSPSGAD